MNRMLSGFVLLFLVLTLARTSFAAEFKVWRIGSLNTGGKLYKIWYYTGVNPILSGTTSDGSNVDIYIDDTVQTVRAEDNGNWLYKTQLKNGTHTITISSESNSYTFKLVMGTEAVAGATSQMPVTGGVDATILASAVGIMLFGSGYYLRKKYRT